MIYLNVIMEKIYAYFKKDSLPKLNKILKECGITYNIKENLSFIKIRFDQPEKLLLDIIKTVEILSKNNIPFLELGLSSNRVYIIIENKYKEEFASHFEFLI